MDNKNIIKRFEKEFPTKGIEDFEQLIKFKTFILKERKRIEKVVEEMKERNRNSIDKIPEKSERDRMTNLLNENMVFGYQNALTDFLDSI